MDYQFSINDFEGPLDLLLHLVKTSKMNIYDIDIKLIIDEYLKFIESEKNKNIDIASSYLVMASELIHLKSKMLVNDQEVEETPEEEFAITSEEDLKRKILEYEKYKKISENLVELESKRNNFYTKSPMNLEAFIDKGNMNFGDVSLQDLVEALKKFKEREKLNKPLHTKVTKKEYSIERRINDIRKILQVRDKVEFLELFNEPTKDFMIVTFLSILTMSKNDEITYGVLPIENSSTGSINDNYDLIREYGFYIILDTNIKVNQNLLGIKGSKLADIKIVYSHPQALMQSKSFLKEHNIISRTYSNTAASAKYIKELNDKSIGSICSKSCAKLYDLDILAQNINESSTNTTRFLVISKNLEIRENAKQISIIFNLKHEIGSLSQILEDIKDYNLNMTRIESRPIKDKPFEYYFYIDFLGNIKSSNVIRALTKIKEDTINLKIIGNY